MGKKTLKLYGRVKFNKLDVFIGIVATIIAVGALWMSIGIAIADAGAQASRVLLDVALGLGFISSVSAFGQSAVVSVYITFFFYGTLLLLIFGTVFLKTKQIKGRVPGLVAAFVAAIGIIFFIPLAFEYSCLILLLSIRFLSPVAIFSILEYSKPSYIIMNSSPPYLAQNTLPYSCCIVIASATALIHLSPAW